MSKSERLTLGHIRSAFRLVGEVGESGPTWRHHYLSELLRLTGATVVMGGDCLVPAPGRIEIPDPIDLGWASDSDRRVYLEYMADERRFDEPSAPAILTAPTAAWTKSRRQLIPDREYYKSHGYNARREGGNGDYLHSCQPWPADGVICMLQLNRAWADRRFTAVEVKLVRLVQAELALARDARRQRRQELLASGLTRRPRQVLELLLVGRSEKRVAAELGLSEHTVHQYVKAVYAHFGVHSRAELLARWVRP